MRAQLYSRAGKVICTEAAPKALGPYSQAILADNTLYVSGQIGLIPESMAFAGDTVEAQTHQVRRAGACERCSVELLD